MAVGFLFLPFWYVKLTANHYKRDVSAELETALSVITTAYLRTEDIVTAVEENTAYLNPPVSRVFQDFLIQIKMVNPDVQAALGFCGEGLIMRCFGSGAMRSVTASMTGA